MPSSIELEVRGLTKRYSAQVSVGPISFEVRQGEFFSLLGPSGCGKTTTLRWVGSPCHWIREKMCTGRLVARLAVQASIWTLLGDGLDPRLEEAAMSLGANRVQAFFKVTLPLLRSSLVSGAIFAFIISFSDINLALFLSGPQSFWPNGAVTSLEIPDSVGFCQVARLLDLLGGQTPEPLDDVERNYRGRRR
jgi:hypothetical protein